MENFAVSKITVRRAMEELAIEGYLEKQVGKGTKVITNKVISKLSKGKNFSEILTESGHKISKKMVAVAENNSLASLFGDQCYQITRFVYLDEVPYISFNHYLPSWLPLPENEEAYSCSLYSLLANHKIQFQHFVDEF